MQNEGRSEHIVHAIDRDMDNFTASMDAGNADLGETCTRAAPPHATVTPTDFKGTKEFRMKQHPEAENVISILGGTCMGS